MCLAGAVGQIGQNNLIRKQTLTEKVIVATNIIHKNLASLGKFVVIGFLFCGPSLANSLSLGSEHMYRVGTGIYDITGTAADSGMLGYAQITQITHGIHTRLWSRSFVIENPGADVPLLTFSVLDLGFVTHSIKQGVVRRLALKLGEDPLKPKTFKYDNLVLLATHTHSAPGGFSHHTLYNLPFPGFNEQNYEAVVNGVVESVLRAYKNREPGYIQYGENQLLEASHNRSKLAFFENPESKSLQFDTNKTMSQFEFYSSAGEPLGILNFFAVHATTLPNSNKMISSDNKGLASMLFDRDMKSDYLKEKTFVAAFANSEEGDVTPNPIINGKMIREGQNSIEAMEISGRRQYENSKKIFENYSDKQLLTNQIQNVHSFVEVPGLSFDGEPALCEPAFGFSFAAGAEDGPGGFHITEGITASVAKSVSALIGFLRFLTGGLIGSPLLYNDLCQYPKPILLATTRGFPKPWTPRVVPFQLIRMGPVALVAFPGEMTTVSGKRIRENVEQALADIGVERAIIAGLANDYTSYLATPEEYEMQHYEGASTLFGPRSVPVFSQLYKKMAEALKNNQKYPTEPVPDFSKGVWSAYVKPIADFKSVFEDWGEELERPDNVVRVGEVVSAKFRTGNPVHDLGTMKGLFEVQQKTYKRDGTLVWKTVARDWEPETRMKWKRATTFKCIECGESTLSWIPSDKFKYGEYRFWHRFGAKNLFGKVKFYETVSDDFTVVP
jgi:neutral ceramidase